ncbi:MAG: zinc ribbon domain-containing protein [Oscillospiraceae bacterium]|nr:zinc ribbon domain-containing protein [Oscillospiraceae bacterium]
MFQNAGKKIKILAIVSFWVGLLAALIFASAVTESSKRNSYGTFMMILLIAFVGGWLVTLGLYAFGELCENVYEIKESMQKNGSGTPISQSLESSSAVISSGAAAKMVNCPKCGKPTSADSKYCVHCGDLII